MELRLEASSREARNFDNESLRQHYLIEKIFSPNNIHLTYTIYDRMIIGGAMPILGSIELPNPEKLRAEYFLERRELGAINIGGEGSLEVDGKIYLVGNKSAIYIGKGKKSVKFSSKDSKNPALFYILSAPAHAEYPTATLQKEDVEIVKIGTLETSNNRTIYKYIHGNGLQSCQLVMGLTELEPGSVWNTMPAHTHDRRMEAYLYFNVQPGQAVLHLMGEPQETKHIWVKNHQAIISPPWSIHSGAGTQNYSFIWGMAGENKDYTDMDFAEIKDLR